MLTANLRPKACRQCKTSFTPVKQMQIVCSPMCGLERARIKREAKEKTEAKIKNKFEREQFKARKQALKRIPDLIKEAQTVFNRWIRARDEKEPCISCGAPPPDLSGLHAGRDAGHYRSTGSASHLRFHEDNCHAQCVRCNQWGAGRAVEYRVGLLAKVGAVRVESLESNNLPHKWQRDELIAIRAQYAEKLKNLKKENR